MSPRDLGIAHCRGRCLPEVEQAAWQLVWLSRDLADNALAAFTGKLLALVGPLDEHCIAFTRSPTPGLAMQALRSPKKASASQSSSLHVALRLMLARRSLATS